MRSSAASAAAAVVLAASLVLIGAGSGAVQAFYLPGVAPREFSNGEAVEVKVSSLSSRKTKIPYSYYDFAVCTPKDGVDHAAENLGEVLVGDRIESTPYKVGMAENKKCTVLCKVDLDEEKLKNLRRLVTEEYNVNMLADNLPAATSISTGDGSDVEDADVYYSMGWPTGGSYCAKAAAGEGAACKEEDQKLYFNNHLVFKMFYHTPDAQAQQPIVDVDGSIVTTGGGSDTSGKDGDSGTPKKRLVKFEIEPFSVRHQYDRNKDKFDAADVSTCGSSPIVHQVGNGYDQTLDEGTKDIVYSYAVEWYSSEQKWATRWDIYLTMDESFSDGVHWFSIINSVLIGVFLTTMVAMIMVRTLRRDLARYNRVPTEEEKAEEREESGWKLVHGDVFRPPRAKMVFAVVVGTGVQCLGMAMVVVVFAALGFLSPANRGSLLTAVLTLFVLMGMVGGYHSARMYKSLKGEGYQRTTFLTAAFFPGMCFLLFFILNIVVLGAGGVGVPFTSMLAMMALWFCISLPLCFLGAYIGYSREVAEYPTATVELPRQIPPQIWYMHPVITAAVGGILPFGVVFVELFFILTSLWLDQYYYVFGFLLVVLIILGVTCAEITIVLTYFQLCGEDYEWWWRSYLTSGACAIYVFLYSAYYYATELSLTQFAGSAVFFGYSFMGSVGLFFACGSLGFLCTHWFVVKIYGAVKVD